MNGTCIDQDNTYTCSCFDGFKGTNCDGKLSHFCGSHLCFICLYYVFQACSILPEINPACSNITCQNGGSCVYINETSNAICVCFNNFAGVFCEGITIRKFGYQFLINVFHV